jgi:hypothetical protein
MAARVDLHAHSRFSDRPDEWLLRRLGAPECFTEPLEVYRACREAGMDFVTITDHDRIEGALEIAHLPGAFVSCEVTAEFPEDRCAIHCLVWGIDEERHREIQARRRDLYELVGYLGAEGIPHAVAHPLFRQNDRLTVAHFERLILLFRHFETINGTRAARACDLARVVLSGLTPESIDHLADRHDLAPTHDQPWRKAFTGGSDDHAGLYLGSAHTVTPPAADASELLAHLMAGRHEPAGRHGSATLLARCFYSIACQYYRYRLASRPGREWEEPLGTLFERLLRDGDLSGLSTGDRLRLWAAGALRPRKAMGTIDLRLVEELAELGAPPADGNAGELEERCFRIAGRLCHDLSYGALRKFGKHLSKGRLTESLQSLSSLGPALLSVAPYLAGCQTQHKDEELHCRVEEAFGLPVRDGRGEAKAWFTDVFHGENGPPATVQRLATVARGRGVDITVLTSQGPCAAAEAGRRDFPPLGRVRLRELGDLEVAFPPFMDMLAFCESERFTEILVSTPGPVGLVGLASAKLLGVPLTAVYAGDLHERVRAAIASPSLEAGVGRLLVWFFGQTRRVFVPSAEVADELLAQGLEAWRVRVVPELFSVASARADAAA